MPEMDGYELCRALKADPALRAIPVILLTSHTEPDDIFRGLEVKADNYLSQQLRPDDVPIHLRPAPSSAIDHTRSPASPSAVPRSWIVLPSYNATPRPHVPIHRYPPAS